MLQIFYSNPSTPAGLVTSSLGKKSKFPVKNEMKIKNSVYVWKHFHGTHLPVNLRGPSFRELPQFSDLLKACDRVCVTHHHRFQFEGLTGSRSLRMFRLHTSHLQDHRGNTNTAFRGHKCVETPRFGKTVELPYRVLRKCFIGIIICRM